jgi:sugar phosphate isomerase/epimerase
MRLALNTFVYEVGRVPIRKTLESAHKFGFEFVEYAAYGYGDPTAMSTAQRREIVAQCKGLGLKCSQLLLANTQHMASPVEALRRKTMDYMQQCADFALELGGHQVLVCWGCGVHEKGMVPEQAWMHTVAMLREYAQWGLDKGILVDMELDPHVYFVVNNLQKMAKVVEDVGLPNVFPNVDIGHLEITREGPERLEKVKDRIIHVHISETDTFAHTNSIIGSGTADFRSYVDKVLALGIEENCQRLGETAVAGIEMGEPGGEVDNPDRWVQESLDYLARILPELRK